ncbi:PAS domain S-box protein [Arenibaculum pallidiluteum]|uniref:PAS domain S-box protein n=1 Tax=Arenibaculum pallidiluteum TaxID=2812559 RepID=UPI001A9755E4|nr:PAS domain S-box protein [Arenibaculum pallidiluteum]
MANSGHVQQAWLTAVVESSDDAIASKDLNGIVMSWNGAAERLFGYTAEEMIGNHISVLAAPGCEDEMPSILERIRRGEKIDHFETRRRRKDGTLVDISLTVSPVRDESGTIVGASKIARDISERKRTERQLQLMSNELNHRAKNVLAVAQAMLRLTRADTIEQYLAAVQGRIAALARVHTQVATSEWKGTDLRTLVQSEMEPFHSDTVQIRIDGPTVRLDPIAAQSIVIVLHELATNATKYGALSVEGGTLDVSWDMAPGRGDLVLRWSEAKGPPVKAPLGRSFGSRVIERQVPEQLGGTARIDWLPTGLRGEFTIPPRYTLPIR